jgi:hypothetical protein
MSHLSKTNFAPIRARISLDVWAVALALALAFLVWSGLIKHVSW